MADQIGRGAIISMGYTHWSSCPVIALCCKPTVSMAPPTALLFHFHTGCPPTSRAMRAILQDPLIRIPPSITLTAASGSEQQQLHTQGSPPSSGWGVVWSSTTNNTYTTMVPTDKSFRHSYGNVSTMTTPCTHTHAHAHTHTHTHTAVFSFCTTTWNQSSENQSIWKFWFHLDGTL